MRRINDKGLSLIKHVEGLRLDSYPDEGGVWTIGYGHTGPDVHMGMLITPKEAEDLLELDLIEAEECVDEACPFGISDNHFAALVLFAFNVGCAAFRKSTLLKNMQEGDLAGAQYEFQKWHHVGGRDSWGLYKRRIAEARLFGEEDETA